MIRVKEYSFENGKNLSNVVKGDIITSVEQDTYDFSEMTLRLRVDRVNKNTISVTCIDGYMNGSAWKICKPTI